VHDALPGTPAFGDEGAANHTLVQGPRQRRRRDVRLRPHRVRRLGAGAEEIPGAPDAGSVAGGGPPARPVAERTVYIQQNPDVIDQGVFHNDVIAVGNANALFYHEQAFADEAGALDQLRRAMAGVGADLNAIRVDTAKVPVADAVASYLFNSQLLSKDNGKMALVIPHECQEVASVAAYLKAWWPAAA
jgi:succinylarginine dihydrolase